MKRTPIIDLESSVKAYWRSRLDQVCRGDSYAGVPMMKFPEDLRAYEHILWSTRPNVCIELGSNCGGSALWFRDRMLTLKHYGLAGDPLVISVDMDIRRARADLARIDKDHGNTIALIQGDVTDPNLPNRVASLIPADARCMVIEDSAHTYATTRASLDGFWRLVSPGCFFVVEDGCVDIDDLRMHVKWPRGVLPAIREWLQTDTGRLFSCRRDLEMYGLTCHPEGFLQRLR